MRCIMYPLTLNGIFQLVKISSVADKVLVSAGLKTDHFANIEGSLAHQSSILSNIQGSLDHQATMLSTIQSSIGALGTYATVGCGLSAVSVFQLVKVQRQLQNLDNKITDGFLDLKQYISENLQNLLENQQKQRLAQAYHYYLQGVERVKSSLLIKDISLRNQHLAHSITIFNQALSAYETPGEYQEINLPARLRRLECCWAMRAAVAEGYALQGEYDASLDSYQTLQKRICTDSLDLLSGLDDTNFKFVSSDLHWIFENDVKIIHAKVRFLEEYKKTGTFMPVELDVQNTQADEIFIEQLSLRGATAYISYVTQKEQFSPAKVATIFCSAATAYAKEVFPSLIALSPHLLQTLSKQDFKQSLVNNPSVLKSTLSHSLTNHQQSLSYSYELLQTISDFEWYWLKTSLRSQDVIKKLSSLECCNMFTLYHEIQDVHNIIFDELSLLIKACDLDKDVFIFDEIPEKRLKNAISTYAQELGQDEKILLLVDKTLFGTAKEGLLLSNKMLYISSGEKLPIEVIHNVTSVTPKLHCLFLDIRKALYHVWMKCGLLHAAFAKDDTKSKVERDKHISQAEIAYRKLIKLAPEEIIGFKELFFLGVNDDAINQNLLDKLTQTTDLDALEELIEFRTDQEAILHRYCQILFEAEQLSCKEKERKMLALIAKTQNSSIRLEYADFLSQHNYRFEFDKVVELYPQHAQLLLKYVVFLNKKLQFTHTIEVCNALICQQLALTQDELITLYLQRGLACKELGHYEEALALYETAIVLKPHNTEIIWLKIEVLMRLKRYEDALEVLGQLPESKDIFFNRLLLLSKLNRYQEIRHIVPILFPENLNGYYQLIDNLD